MILKTLESSKGLCERVSSQKFSSLQRKFDENQFFKYNYINSR